MPAVRNWRVVWRAQAQRQRLPSPEAHKLEAPNLAQSVVDFADCFSTQTSRSTPPAGLAAFLRRVSTAGKCSIFNCRRPCEGLETRYSRSGDRRTGLRRVREMRASVRFRIRPLDSHLHPTDQDLSVGTRSWGYRLLPLRGSAGLAPLTPPTPLAPLRTIFLTG